MEIIQCAKVSLSGGCRYNSYERFGRKIYGYSEEANKKDKERFIGDLSRHTKKKIRMILDSWSSAIIVKMSKKRQKITYLWQYMTFVTLTLSANQLHDDREIKDRMLNPFLKYIKEQFDVKNFLWVAEAQENGNIHFHMLVDRPIPKKDLQRLWNTTQKTMGYVDRYRKEQKEWHKDGFKPRPWLFESQSLEKQLQAYENGLKCGWSNPPSTFIEAVQDYYDVYNYLCNYFVGQGGKIKQRASRRKIEGRLWSCSYKLSNIAPYSEALDSQTVELISKLENHKMTKKYEAEYATIYYYHTKSVIRIFRKYLDSSVCRYYFHLYRHLYENGYHPYESAKIPIPKKPSETGKPFLDMSKIRS